MIDNRTYSVWNFHYATTMIVADLPIDPAAYKLFPGDKFVYMPHAGTGSGTGTGATMAFQLVDSAVRRSDNISGVLILKGSKTYGRCVTAAGKPGKLLYKCVPDDRRIPIFLIPYEMKAKDMGFSKNHTNRYVTFNFADWSDKHPVGRLATNIGPVDVLDNYYEYQLFCKNLSISNKQFISDTHNSLKRELLPNSDPPRIHDDIVRDICTAHPDIEDRTGPEWNVFSIDPAGSTDFDDAVSLRAAGEVSGIHGAKGGALLSIYIANVTMWMSHLDLWTSFSKRVATIYLPDQKRPMLPSILSDCLCSLIEGRPRIALVLDLLVVDGQVLEANYRNAKICVTRNFRYEEPDLLAAPEYKELLATTRKMVTHRAYIKTLRDSHDVVAYTMILMNHRTAQTMLSHRVGVFRSVIATVTAPPPQAGALPEDVEAFFRMWNSGSGQYVDLASMPVDVDGDGDGDDTHAGVRHDILGLDAYIHITSPIRRLVDLLNIIQLQKTIGLVTLTEGAKTFYAEWINNMEYLNTAMRNIRKMQNDCELVAMVTNTPAILEREYRGYVFDRIDRAGVWQYSVYIPDLKLVSKMNTCTMMENYCAATLHLHLFSDEDFVKRKVRVSMLPAAPDHA